MTIDTCEDCVDVHTRRAVTVQIFSVVHDVRRIDLCVKIAGAEKQVNRELISMGYADQAEESYLSHVNETCFVILVWRSRSLL